MPVASRIVADIRSDLRRHGQGTVGSVRLVRRKWSKVLKDKPAELVMDVVMALAGSGTWPERLVAFELLESHPGAFGMLNATCVTALSAGFADWPSVDHFGVTVAGPAWRDGLIKDGTVHKWTTSADRWRRRLALVATVRLNTPARGQSPYLTSAADSCLAATSGGRSASAADHMRSSAS